MLHLSNMNVLLTGGAGFIGSNIAEKFLENGVKFIRILDNLSTGKMENIQELLTKFKNIEFIEGDITNFDTCTKCMKGINVVCHQAALGSVPRSINNPQNSHNSNVNGFFNILLSAKNEGIKRIVYASSSSVYGDNEDLPKLEDKIGKVLSPYAATKFIDEIYAWTFHNNYQMECIGLRYFNVFGAKQALDGEYVAVIPKFITSILKSESPFINGKGDYSRDFTHVDNVVLANLLALTTQNENCFGQVFNVGIGGRVTILELFNEIQKKMNSTIEPLFHKNREGDMPHSKANIDKAIELLDYKVITNFEEGIEKTIQYYMNYYETDKNMG